MGRPSWDEYFGIVAGAIASRSDCERSKVGAVVVKDGRIVGTGYNGAPAGWPGCASCPRRTSDCEPGSSYDTGPGSCVALHAEANALIYTDRTDLQGATLYLTRKPCDGCAKLIAGAGIARVVVDGEEPYDVAPPMRVEDVAEYILESVLTTLGVNPDFGWLANQE